MEALPAGIKQDDLRKLALRVKLLCQGFILDTERIRDPRALWEVGYQDDQAFTGKFLKKAIG